MDPGEITTRFAHHPSTSQARVAAHERVRLLCADLARKLALLLPDSPEATKALDALDLVAMHANAALARRGGPRPGLDHGLTAVRDATVGGDSDLP